MILQGELTLQAPIQKVWEAFLDPQTLLACIPGAEKIVKIDEKTYDCLVKQKVGPITVRFKFKAIITQMKSPSLIEFMGEGEDIAKAGHMSHRTTVELKELANKTQVSYSSSVSITGRLAIFGDKIMRAKSKSLEAEMVKNLQDRLSSIKG